MGSRSYRFVFSGVVAWNDGITAWKVAWDDDVTAWKCFPHYWPFVQGCDQSPCRFPSLRVSDIELSYVLYCWPEQSVEQTVELPVI